MKLYLLIAIAIFLGSCNFNNNTSLPKSTQPDSLNYEMITMMQSLSNCEKDSDGCTYIEFCYPQFTNLNGPLADSLSKQLNSFFNQVENKTSNYDSLQLFFLHNYEAYKLSTKDYNLPWFIEKEVSIINQNNKWITLQLSEHSFMGGAHPNSYTFYKMIDKSNVHQLHLIDFFDSIAINKLTILGEPLFCAEKGISPQKGFEEAGFWFPNNHFALNNNFYFNEAGLTFFYNPYEVGPYVMGHTEITIPASKVSKLIRLKSN